jgi:hypothetical protein
MPIFLLAQALAGHFYGEPAEYGLNVSTIQSCVMTMDFYNGKQANWICLCPARHLGGHEFHMEGEIYKDI